MDEEYDDLALGFVPDHYLTEYCHPGDAGRREVVAELERFRGMGSRDIVARALLIGGFSFPAVNLQADLDTTRAIVLASPPTLGREVQQRLADFVVAGGRLLLAGVLPTKDTDGTPCTVLGDALGLSAGPIVDGSPHYFPSVRAAGQAVEVRVGYLQELTGGEPFAHDIATGHPVAAEVHPGAGHAIVLDRAAGPSRRASPPHPRRPGARDRHHLDGHAHRTPPAARAQRQPDGPDLHHPPQW
jgi:beta-galactosidase